MSLIPVGDTSAPSPFDESGTQYVWDSTSLGTLKTCPRKYQLSMLQHWRPKTYSHHLTFGTHYHKALERFEHLRAEGADHESALRIVVRRALEDLASEPIVEDPKGAKTPWGLLRSIVWRIDHYRDDPAKTVILANGKPAVELTFRFEIDNGLFLSGHLDRIVEFNGRYVMDHKTAGRSLTGYYFQGFNPDNQMTLYSVAARIAFDQPVNGVIIDAAQIAVGFTEFARDITTRTDPQLEEFLEGVYAWHATARAYTDAGFWPMNETACDNYGGCPFKPVCKADPRVRERVLRTEYTNEYRWNPLHSRGEN